jgi:predicted component of type VI protein secretion system
MDAKTKREALRAVPTRKLLASIKRDLRKTMNASRPAAKPKKA